MSSPLLAGDRMISVAGISTAPIYAEPLARFLANSAPGTAVAVCVFRKVAEHSRVLNLSLPLPAAVRDPGDLGMAFEPVLLRTSRGQSIHGWYIPPPHTAALLSPAIVFAHGRQRNRRFIGLTDLAVPAHERGYGLLLVDLLGCGESDGPVDFWANEEITLGVNFLSSRPEIDRRRIGVVGASFGGMKAMRAAGEPSLGAAALAILSAADMTPRHVRLVAPPISLPRCIRHRLLRGVTFPGWFVLFVTIPVDWWFRWSTGHSLFDASPVRTAAKVTCPVFLAHGTEDRTFTMATARKIFDTIPTQKAFFPVEGHDHFTAVHSGRPLLDAMFAFLEVHLAESDVSDANRSDGATREVNPRWHDEASSDQTSSELPRTTAAD